MDVSVFFFFFLRPCRLLQTAWVSPLSARAMGGYSQTIQLISIISLLVLSVCPQAIELGAWLGSPVLTTTT